MTKGYNGYLIPKNERSNILSRFPPQYKRVVAHHVTHEFGVEESLPPDTDYVTIIGHADSGDGIEALVVTVNGKVKKPDGRPYHITLSLDMKKYKPNDSNALITKKGYKSVNPVMIKVEPKFFPL